MKSMQWTESPFVAALSKTNITIPWRSIQVLVPHRFRRRLRSKIRNRQSPASSLTALQTSFSPVDTLKALQSHRWTIYDGQYLFLALLGLFCLCIIEEPGALVKFTIATLLLTALVIPITRQFFLPALSIFSYLILFYSVKFIPSTWRPSIWVRVLPALENIFYGANISNILSANKSTFLDVLAWLPYGIMHFGAPFVVSAIIFIFAPPTTTAVWARSFGYMNVAGVLIQLVFPCSPPWYENMYGLAPANYAMPGSPAGLAAIDKLFGIDFYVPTFTASPQVFGAFPSMHAATSTIEALFMSHVFPKLRPLFITYVIWLWWATMYLSHHYAVDLVAGSMLAAVVFYYAKANYLPRIQPDKTFRWDYDYIECGDAPTNGYGYDLASTDDRFNPESDEWTIGSSSSVSSGSMSPTEEAQSVWEEQRTTTY